MTNGERASPLGAGAGDTGGLAALGVMPLPGNGAKGDRALALLGLGVAGEGALAAGSKIELGPGSTGATDRDDCGLSDGDGTAWSPTT